MTLDENSFSFICPETGIFEQILATSFPTVSPTNAPTEAEEEKDSTFLYIGIGAGGLGLAVLALLFVAYLLGKTSGSKRLSNDKHIPKKRKGNKFKTKLSLSENGGYVVQINIPANASTFSSKKSSMTDTDRDYSTLHSHGHAHDSLEETFGDNNAKKPMVGRNHEKRGREVNHAQFATISPSELNRVLEFNRGDTDTLKDSNMF